MNELANVKNDSRNAPKRLRKAVRTNGFMNEICYFSIIVFINILDVCFHFSLSFVRPMCFCHFVNIYIF